MSFRTFYLRKKYWLNDFLHGSQMWKQYRDIMQIIDNQDVIKGGGKAGILEKYREVRKRKCPILYEIVRFRDTF